MQADIPNSCEKTGYDACIFFWQPVEGGQLHLTLFSRFSKRMEGDADTNRHFDDVAKN